MTTALRVVPTARSETSRFLTHVAQRVGASLDLAHTLQHITTGCVDLLGFGVAALNLVRPDGALEVVAVQGPPDAVDVLLGSTSTREEWDRLFEHAQALGALLFVPHDSPGLLGEVGGITRWVPSIPRQAHPEAWHAGDELFAPLLTPGGEWLGVLSVDLPPDGRRPGPRVRELLELFAVQAALALDHARLHAQVGRDEALLRRTFEQAPVGMAVIGGDKRFQQVNAAFCTFLAREPGELVGRTCDEFTHPADLALNAELSRRLREEGKDVIGVEKRYLRPDGSVVWGRLTLTTLDIGYGEVRVLAQLEDVTVSRAHARELARRANTDGLTGLDNRSALLDHLAETVGRPGVTAVLYCDVDHFKTVNDTLGHATGDELLIDVARNLQAVLRPGDRAGRFGGDEFVVVLHDVDATVAIDVAERIRKACRRVLRTGDDVVLTSMTVGVALSSSAGTASGLLARADLALLKAKRQGRDRVVLA